MPDNPNFSGLIRNVAIATDFSPWSERATQHALVVAQRFGAVLHFLHIVRRSEFCFVPGFMVQLDELAERDCGDLMGRLNAAHSLDDIEHRCWNILGETTEAFGDFVRDRKIDLLVLGTRGRNGLTKLLFGSIAQQIFHSIACPVLTVGPWSRGATRQLKLNKVLFATDLSAEAAAAIPFALTAARTWGAEIDVLHVCSSVKPDCEQPMEAFSRKMDVLTQGEAPLSIRYHVLPGNPAATVLAFASENKEDLIVLGLDRHRSLYSGPSVSHAYEIVRQARCPVLNVRWASGFPSSPASNGSSSRLHEAAQGSGR